MSFMKYTVEWYADLFKETEIEADNKAALSKAKNSAILLQPNGK